MKCLLLVDVQNDFMPGGALPVPGGDAIVPEINRIMPSFDLVVATQDWHPQGHLSFASSHPGKTVFDVIQLDGKSQTLWPDHAIQGSFGAEFHPELNQKPIDAIIRKGTNKAVDSYSGFYDNQSLSSTGLAGYLFEKKVTTLYVGGLAADICVYYTILDALALGLNTVLVESATRALDDNQFKIMKQQLSQSGVSMKHPGAFEIQL